jgi:hypothetical protein
VGDLILGGAFDHDVEETFGAIPPLPNGYVASPDLLAKAEEKLAYTNTGPSGNGTNYAYRVEMKYDLEDSAPPPGGSTWLQIVDRLSSTGWYDGDEYVITDVHFDSANKLIHLRLSQTKAGGNFVVYDPDGYHYNSDPAAGSPA